MDIEEKALHYDKIVKIAKATRKQLLELRKNCDRENPIDMDQVKTCKAMFFEKIRKEVFVNEQKI